MDSMTPKNLGINIQYTNVKSHIEKTALYSTIQYSTVQYSTVHQQQGNLKFRNGFFDHINLGIDIQCANIKPGIEKTVLDSTIQYSKVEYSTVQYSKVHQQNGNCELGNGFCDPKNP